MIENLFTIALLLATLFFALLAFKPLFVRYAARGNELEVKFGGLVTLAQIHRDSMIDRSTVMTLSEAMKRIRSAKRRSARFELNGLVHPWSSVVVVETSGPVRFWILSSRAEILEWLNQAAP